MGVLLLKSGDDLFIKFTITDSDDTAVNITGGTIRFKIAKNIDVTDAAAEYFDSYTTFTDAANGIHIEKIPDLTSAGWTPGPYIYQARFIDSSSDVRTEDHDRAEIEQNLIEDE